MIEAGLVTLMEATTAITDVTAERIYGVQLPQKPTVPAIVITNITGEDEYSATGALDLIPVRFQIDCYAATLDASIALGNIVNALLSGFKGAAGAETIQGSFLKNRKDLYDSETENHRRLLEYDMKYKV